MIYSGQVLTKIFFTYNGFGMSTDADSTPTGTLAVNGADDAATVAISNLSTGRYKATVTLPELAVGDVVDLSITATVGGVARSAVVYTDVTGVVAAQAGDEMDLTDGALGDIAEAVPPPDMSPVKAVTDKLDTIIEETDDEGIYRLTSSALSNAPDPVVPGALEITQMVERDGGMVRSIRNRVLNLIPGTPVPNHIEWIAESDNVTAVILESPDGTYGVRRKDTLEVIVPSGTPMVLAEDGEAWYYDFEADGPAEFEYRLKVVEEDA